MVACGCSTYYNYVLFYLDLVQGGTLGTYYWGSYLIVYRPLGVVLLPCTLATCIMVLVVLLCVQYTACYFPHGCQWDEL